MITETWIKPSDTELTPPGNGRFTRLHTNHSKIYLFQQN